MSILDRMPSASPARALNHPQSTTRRGGCWDAYPPIPAPLALRLQQDLQEDDLPLDPRVWNRSEVAKWVSRRGGQPDRFPMNGKALCLMSAKMFAARVPHQPTATALHHDFKRRLAKALAVQEIIEEMSTK